MPQQTAGILLYRRRDGVVEVLLVHPGGPYWTERDEGAWSIPKGEPGPDEDLLAAAKRELQEQTGLTIQGALFPLAAVRQGNGNAVYAWALEADWDPTALHSKTFVMSWPPGSTEQRTFPEVDRAEWFPLAEAGRRITPGQARLLDELRGAVG